MKIHARAVLLEEHESGVHSVNKALQRVVAELGPNSMDEQEALRWWRRFIDGDFNISDGASLIDLALLKNGTFLRASRALFWAEKTRDFYRPCNMSGVDDRFYIVSINFRNYVVDTFYGIKREVILDCSDIPIDDMNAETLEKFQFRHLHFLTENRVLGIGDSFANGNRIFCGTFSFTSCVLKFEKVITLNRPWFPRYLMFRSATQQPSIALSSGNSNRMQYAPININDRDLSLDPLMEVPFRIFFTTILDDKIFGFGGLEMMCMRQLIVFSLTSRTKTVYKVETNGLEKQELKISSPHTWNEGKLWVARYNWDSLTTTVIQFDLQTLKWQETKLEVKGKIEILSLVNNSLILHGFIWTHWCSRICVGYRFPFGRCDSLSTSVWNSIRRYSQVHPEFNRWIASKLPNSLRHYSPLWD